MVVENHHHVHPRVTAPLSGFWNIISIREPSTPRWSWREAKAIHDVCFHDAENLAADGNIVFARKDDLVGILKFADSRPLEPLLITVSQHSGRVGSDRAGLRLDRDLGHRGIGSFAPSRDSASGPSERRRFATRPRTFPATGAR